MKMEKICAFGYNDLEDTGIKDFEELKKTHGEIKTKQKSFRNEINAINSDIQKIL